MKGNFTILLVEDEENDALLFTRALKMASINNPVAHVRDGEEAIRYLLGKEPFEDRKKHPYPELVVTDIKMPKVNGIELLTWLRDNPAFQVIPTIVLSSSTEAREIRHCYLMGANAYFVKPPTVDLLSELAAAISSFWSKAEIPAP